MAERIRTTSGPSTAADLYIDLLKRSLLNLVYLEHETPVRPKDERARLEERLDRRVAGRDWPRVAHTMMGQERLDNLQECLEEVIRSRIPGDIIETGVWRGGGCIFARGVLKAHGDTHRKVWVADSFEGLPRPNESEYPADTGDKHHSYDFLRVGLDEVKSNFALYGLLDEQVAFLEGWFKDTLPDAPIDQLAVLRLDGDMYESTMTALRHLYAKVSIGGFVIVDDYGAIPAAKRATDDFRSEHAIRDELIQVDWTGVYWRKTS